MSVLEIIQACRRQRYNRSLNITSSEYNIFAISRSPRSASARVHVEVRNGYGRAEGVGAAPLKTALERSYLTENSSSENRILKPRRKKSPERILPKTNDHIYIYIYFHERKGTENVRDATSTTKYGTAKQYHNR